MSTPVVICFGVAILLGVAGGLLAGIGPWYRNLRLAQRADRPAQPAGTGLTGSTTSPAVRRSPAAVGR